MNIEQMIKKWDEQIALHRRVCDDPLMYTKEERLKNSHYAQAICAVLADLKQVKNLSSNTVLADSSILLWSEANLKRGDWIYTPDEVFGSGGAKHNIFQYDERINYSLHFGHEIRWYKLCV